MNRILPMPCKHTWHDKQADKKHPGVDHSCDEDKGHKGDHVCIFCKGRGKK